jgi:GTP-binding protein
MEAALEVYEHRKQKVSSSKLNDIMLKVIDRYPPPMVRGYAVRIKYVTQLPTVVPSFAFFCNHPKDIKTPYRNYLENQLRSHFSFSGVPLRIFFREK